MTMAELCEACGCTLADNGDCPWCDGAVSDTSSNARPDTADDDTVWPESAPNDTPHTDWADIKAKRSPDGGEEETPSALA